MPRVTTITLTNILSSISCLSWATISSKEKAVQLLLDGPVPDELVDPDAEYILHGGFIMMEKGIQLMLQHVLPPWSTWDFDKRLVAAYGFCNARRFVYDFWACLDQSRLDPDCLIRSTNYLAQASYESLVGRLSVTLAAHWAGHHNTRDFGGWRSLLYDALHHGAIKVAFDHKCDSPMLGFLFSTPRRRYYRRRYGWLSSDLSPERLTHKLQFWARTVQEGGQDLKQYGKLEAKWLSLRTSGYRLCMSNGCKACATFKVTGFRFGGDPSQWQIWISTSVEEMAGTFWHNVIEDPDPAANTPGGWFEEQTPCTDLPDSVSLSWFFYSRRHLRRLLRYLGLTEEEFRGDAGKEWHKYSPTWFGGAALRRSDAERQQKFFLKHGIPPIPRLQY